MYTPSQRGSVVEVTRDRLEFLDVSRRLFVLVRDDATVERDSERDEHADGRQDDGRGRDRRVPGVQPEADPCQYRHLVNKRCHNFHGEAKAKVNRCWRQPF